MAENGRYYQIEGEKATAENIDYVLSDLTEMLVDGPDDPNKVAVIYEEVQDPEDPNDRPHFRFGEAGSEIPGDDNQIVVADGEGNAKANVAKFHIENEIEGESPNTKTIAKIIAKNNQYVTFGSDVEIGNQTYWGTAKKKATLTLRGAPQIIMESYNGSPILSASGRGIIEMVGENLFSPQNSIQTAYSRSNGSGARINGLSWLADNVYKGYDSPFRDSYVLKDDGYVYPYLHFANSSTLIMEGASMIKTSHGAAMELSGNATFKIIGGGRGIESTIQPYPSNIYQTCVQFLPGSFLQLSSEDNTYGPGIYMVVGSKKDDNSGNNSQIILSNQFNHNNNGSPVAFCDSLPGIMKTTGSGFEPTSLIKFYSDRTFASRNFVREKLINKDYAPGTIYNQLSNIYAPTLALQGKSSIIIGDTGRFGARIATIGALEVDWTTKGEVGIKRGCGDNALELWDITTESGAKQHIKFGTAEGGDTAIAIEFMGSTSIKFCPENVFGVSITPRNTDIICQWKNLEGIFETQDGFIQVEGNSHFESWDNTKIIMRGSNVNVLEPNKYTNGPRISITGTTSTDCTGMTYEQLLGKLTDSQRIDLNLALKPSFSSIAKMRVTGGSATSTEYYSKRYRVKAGPFSINKKNDSVSSSNFVFSFHSPDDYSNITSVQNSEGYKDVVKSLYGENAVVSSADFAKTRTSWGYYYYINANITNIELTFNTATNYPVGTSWSNVSDDDKAGLTRLDDTSQAEITSIEVRPDMVYNTSIADYTYYTGTHLGEDWSEPVLATDGPVNQMYGSPNLCMRGKFSLGLQGTSSYQSSQIYTNYNIANPIETYDPTLSQEELISQFIKGADYAKFEAWTQLMVSKIFPIRDYYFDHITSFTVGKNSINIGAGFEYKKLSSSTIPHNPTFEMIGDSELRIANGISITTDIINGESVVKISNPEGSVSFSMSELKALKALLV